MNATASDHLMAVADTRGPCADVSEPLWDDDVAGETPAERDARHARAIAICRSCTITAWCEARRQPWDSGVWAGKLHVAGGRGPVTGDPERDLWFGSAWQVAEAYGVNPRTIVRWRQAAAVGASRRPRPAVVRRGVCADCAIPLVTPASPVPEGHARHWARGLCVQCYGRRNKAGEFRRDRVA